MAKDHYMTRHRYNFINTRFEGYIMELGFLFGFIITISFFAIPILLIYVLYRHGTKIKQLQQEVKQLKEDSITDKFNQFVADYRKDKTC